MSEDSKFNDPMLRERLTAEIAIAPVAWAKAWTVAEWKPSTVKIYSDRISPYADIGITPEALFDLFSTARSAPAQTYYVATTGNDSTGDGTAALPWATGGKAATAANLAATPTMIRVAAGTYPRSSNFSNGGGTLPTTDIAWIATGGRVVTGTFDTFTSPTLDGTYTNTYSAVLTNVNRVMNLTTFDRFGNYVDLLLVGSAALCNLIPNSWFYDTGTNTYYINRSDGAAVTATNTRIHRSTSASIKVTSPVNIFLGGATSSDGFDVEGGDNGACLNYAPTTKPTSNKALIASNCSFKYAGGRVHTAPAGVRIDSIHGVAVLFNCRADANWTDAFNCHNATTTTALPHFVTVNCSGADNGKGSSQSCNGWTTHETVVGADFAGIYNANRGGTYRSINTTISWIVGGLARNDLGDVAQGGSIAPTAFRVDNTAVYYLDQAVIDMPGTSTSMFAASGAAIYTRNMIPLRQPGQGLGTLSTY